MEIGVHSPLEAKFSDKLHNSSSFVTRAGALEGPVRVNRSGTPAFDVLVAPRTDTGATEDIEVL
jgi:hypothetical protein